MRVEAYQKITQIYQTQQTGKMVKTNSTKKRDTLEISQMGKDYQIAKQAVRNASDIRYDKVDEIKKAMKSGTYSVDKAEVAEKLADSLFDFLV